MSTEQWGRKLISLSWVHILSLGELRNFEEHGGSSDQQQLQSIHNLLLEADSLQHTTYPISYVDRDILFRPMETLRQYSLSNLSAWVRNARHLINTYKLQAQFDMRKRTRYKARD